MNLVTCYGEHVACELVCGGYHWRAVNVTLLHVCCSHDVSLEYDFKKDVQVGFFFLTPHTCSVNICSLLSIHNNLKIVILLFFYVFTLPSYHTTKDGQFHAIQKIDSKQTELTSPVTTKLRLREVKTILY